MMTHPAGDRATSTAWCSVVGIPWAPGLAANLHNNRGGSENCSSERLFTEPTREACAGPGERLIESKTCGSSVAPVQRVSGEPG